MDKIHDKANKLFNDVRGKKILVGKNIRGDNTDKAKPGNPDLSLNSCFYCHKVFVSSQFLMKHILRRHSDDLVSLHKNCVKHESNNNTNDFRCLMSFLEKEFFTLKNELLTVRQGVLDKNETDEELKMNRCTEEQEHVIHVSKSSRKTDVSYDNDVNLNELNALKDSISHVERNLESLHCKFEDIDKVLKNDVLRKDDMVQHMAHTDEKIQRTLEMQSTELRKILQSDLQSVLSKQLHENNCEWKLQLSEVKDDIVRLDRIVDNISKQMNSPDSLEEFKKRFENQILYFIDNKSHRNSKKKNSRHEAQSAGSSAKVSRQLRHKITLSENETSSLCLRNKNISKHVNKKTSSLAHTKKFINHKTPNELSFLVAEKFSGLCIEPNTSKLSSDEYKEKLKLLNLQKDYLASTFPKFSEIRNNFDVSANHRVHRHRKIRFSDPLTMDKKSTEHDKNMMPSSAMKNNPMPEASLDYNKELIKVKNQKTSKSDNDKFSNSKEKSFLMIKNRRYPDTGAGGDFSVKLSNSPNASANQPVNAPEFKTPSPVPKSHMSEIAPSLHNYNKPEDVSESKSTFERAHKGLPTYTLEQHSTAKKQRYPYTDGGAGGDFPTIFSKNSNTNIYQMQSIDAQEFMMSSPVSKADNLKKMRVTFSEESNNTNPALSISGAMQKYASAEMQNLNTAGAHEMIHFHLPKQKISLMEDDDLNIEDNHSDASELESLSSWEDEDDNN